MHELKAEFITDRFRCSGINKIFQAGAVLPSDATPKETAMILRSLADYIEKGPQD